MRLTIQSDLNDSLAEDDVLADIGLDHPAGSQESDKWYPYLNKTVSAPQQITQAAYTNVLSKSFLLDAVDNLPRLRISDSLMKVFLWMLREARVRDAPSFASLRKTQSCLHTECSIPTHQYNSAQGNIYFMNDVQKAIANVCNLSR